MKKLCEGCGRFISVKPNGDMFAHIGKFSTGEICKQVSECENHIIGMDALRTYYSNEIYLDHDEIMTIKFKFCPACGFKLEKS